MSAERNLAVRRVAVVLFEDFTVLDADGAIQAFGACRQTRSDGTVSPLFEIFTVGMYSGMVRSGQGPATRVDHTLADAPPWDVLVVPGGSDTRALVDDKAFIAWLRQASERSAITAWDWVLKQGPKVKWQRRARWVDDGDILSSSGVSAGTDMALALIERLNGHDMAIAAARHMEHVWNQDASNDPFA